jgi:tripartite-type tricarboxylate transporter receptor subunit TctC
MTLPRRRFFHLAAAVAALPAAPRFARAQNYPSRPIRWIVGFPAGGATDTVTRLMGNWLSERLGQPVVIENRPGAATNLAAQAALSSVPDGHTLLLALPTNAINAALYETLPFNFLKDSAPVCGFVELPLLLVVNPSLPVKTVAEFIAYAKANPGQINLASFGTGTISHLAGELLKMTTGVKIVHVPYRGGPVVMTDLIAGRVQAAIEASPNVMAHIRSGAVRAIGVLPRTRMATLPDVPSISETLPEYDVRTWSGVVVPKGTPADIIERLAREISAGLSDSRLTARLTDLGGTPTVMGSPEFGALIARDTERWARVIKTAGVKPE